MTSSTYLILTLTTPFIAGIINFLLPIRYITRLNLCFLPILVASPVMLAMHIIEDEALQYAVGNWRPPLGIAFYVDGLASTMLLLIATVGVTVAIYALSYFRINKWDLAIFRAFWPVFFFLWGSLNAIFLMADLFTIYVCLELITLSAVASITLSKGAKALKVALRYLMVALMGSLLYLLGVALIYAQTGTLDWTILSYQPEFSLAVWTALALMTAGLIIKSALFPLHFVLPGAYNVAPAPVSALLSAVVIKASFYVIFRLWGQVFVEIPGTFPAHLIGAFGVGAVIWGSFQAIIQTRIKLMLAYSSVSQIGYLFIALPLLSVARATGNTSVQIDVWNGAVFYIIAHGLAKAALFMATGVFMTIVASGRIADLRGAAGKAPIATLTWALAGISLIGLPPSGGFLAKWLLLTSAISLGLWPYVAVLLVGSLLASIYIFRVLWHAFLSEGQVIVAPHFSRVLPVVALCLAVLVVSMGVRTTEIFALLRVGLPFAGGISP